MPRFIQNPRRRPRVPLRIPVEILQRGESWQAETEDVGPGGCLLSSPRPLVERAQLRLVLRCAAVDAVLNVPGSVAWARQVLGGIAFTPRLRLGLRPDAWFQRILDANPGLADEVARAPDRLDLEAPLYLLPVPRRFRDLARDETALLGRAANGITVHALLSSLPMPEERAAKAIFGLFEKGVLTLSMGRAGEAWKWRAALAGAAAPDRRPRPAPAWPDALARRAPVVIPATLAPPARDVAAGDHSLLRGVGAARRPPQAQSLLEQARAAAGASRIDQAVALLRQALALAPRDAEISTLLGELAFKDRRI